MRFAWLKIGEPDEPPSVTPCPFAVAAQVTRQCELLGDCPFQLVDVSDDVKVDIFLISPDG